MDSNKDQIIEMCIQVRASQKRYFKTRDKYELQKCRNEERKLDLMLIDYSNGLILADGGIQGRISVEFCSERH
jgi:hypothetical protein